MGNTRIRLTSVCIAWAVIAFFASPPSATADSCQRTCNQGKRDCVKIGRVQALGRKLECRAQVSPRELGDCMRSANSGFVSAQHDCEVEREDCSALCEPGGGSGGNGSPARGQCVSSCAQGIGECARGFSLQAETCRQGQCSGLHGGDRAECVRQCATFMHSIAEVCNPAFKACVAGCPRD